MFRPTSPYLSGYTSKSAYVPQGLITFHERRRAELLYRPYARTQPNKDGYDARIDLPCDNGPSNRAIGIEMKFTTAQAIEKFKARMPEARFVDFSNAVAWIRGIKSDLEIAAVRESAGIAVRDAAGERGHPSGVREADAAAEIIAILVGGANGKLGRNLSAFFLCASPLSATAHIRWAEDVLRQGSQSNL